MAEDVTTYALNQAFVAKVEAEVGATFKIRADPEQLDALAGDVGTILDEGDAGAT